MFVESIDKNMDFDVHCSLEREILNVECLDFTSRPSQDVSCKKQSKFFEFI